MRRTGRIIKGIAGFYYVHAQDGCVYECKAKGIFRKDGQKPLVGDFVELAVIDDKELTGNIEEIHARKNELIRPAVANVDQALVIFAVKDPQPNFFLLDTFLARMEHKGIPVILCFNKCDLDTDGSFQKKVCADYAPSGYRTLFTCSKTGEGLKELAEILDKKCSVVAGPSGVGKSSLINRVQDQVEMETGQVSEKTLRGRHTTRHSQLITVAEDSYIVDTPGFTSLTAEGIPKEELDDCFPEIARWKDECRFYGCSHIHEPSCRVLEKLAAGEIAKARYESYVMMYESANAKRRN